MEELQGVKEGEGGLEIGALTTISDLLANRRIETDFPILYQAAAAMASPEIRNRATVGGNICQASPAGDMLTALTGVEATVVILGKGGEEKEVSIHQFIKGPGWTMLADEKGAILVKVRIGYPSLPASGFKKLGRRKAMVIAVVSAGASLIKNGDTVEKCILSLGAVGPKPIRPFQAEEYMVAGPISKERIHKTSLLAVQATSPISDLRAGENYRRATIRVLVERLLSELCFDERGC